MAFFWNWKRGVSMKKRYLAIAVSLFFLNVGFTHSYMKDYASAVNTFSFIGENGISAVLTEPSWNPEKAKTVLPGTKIPKDPCVTNTSQSDIDELVALRVEFLYSSGYPEKEKRGQLLSEEDMDKVSAVFRIDYDADQSGNWVRFEQENEKNPVQHFYYDQVLKRNYPQAGDVTAPLFQNVTVDALCGNEAFADIQKKHGFDIRITGCVLQQMQGEQQYGLSNAKAAYEAGLFSFLNQEK